jgi:Fanconi anemia group M protein
VSRIIVDHQESRSKIPELLRSLGAVVIVAHLASADYLLSKRVGVERKTTFDFVTAIIQKRFYLQAERLRETYSRPLYLIEGRQLYGLRDVHPNFIRGALARLVVDYSIPTVFTHGPEDTAELLLLIARREQGAEHAIGPDSALTIRDLVRGARKPLELHEQQLRILEALPLIGRYRAGQLLSHFGTLKHLVAATERDLIQVPGIGRETARKIKQVLTSTFNGDTLHS